MKRKQIVTIMALAFFAAVVAAPLAAAPECGKPGCPKKDEAKGCAMEQGCMMLQKLPNLSAEQKAKLEKMHAEQQKMMADAKAAMEKLAGEMKALLKDPVDLKKAEAKIDELAAFRAGMQKKCLAHHLAVRALLTDEQKAKLGEMGGCLTGGMMGGMHGCMTGAAAMAAKHECAKDAKEHECTKGKEAKAGHECMKAKAECPMKKAEEKTEEKK